MRGAYGWCFGASFAPALHPLPFSRAPPSWLFSWVGILGCAGAGKKGAKLEEDVVKALDFDGLLQRQVSLFFSFFFVNRCMSLLSMMMGWDAE